MKIFSNEKLIKRNSNMGRIASYIGLAVMAGSMYITFRYPQWITYAYILLFGGLGLSQLGLYYGNRWGRRPRPDEQIDQALKGLDDRFSLYHYLTPTRHLLVGPAGVWVIMHFYQSGKIVYESGRWKQRGAGFFEGYKRLFFQEGIGRPDLEIPAEVQTIEKYLDKKLPDAELPKPKAVLVFTNDRAELEVEQAPVPTVTAAKLKETIRKSGKEKSILPEKVKAIQDAIELSIN
jgi:hypothetical protein